MGRDHPNQPSRHQLPDRPPRERPVDPEAVGENGRRDQLVLGRLSQELVVVALVEEHHVVDLLRTWPASTTAELPCPSSAPEI